MTRKCVVEMEFIMETRSDNEEKYIMNRNRHFIHADFSVLAAIREVKQAYAIRQLIRSHLLRGSTKVQSRAKNWA